ncbi:hypothetical protein RIF29_04097 [Crotalaria pallida]|uniref:Uncharacterized protein n=1 Tax=Crotalaria pallida TaxID=3830 RepID=A0AAN9J0W4_CROPI
MFPHRRYSVIQPFEQMRWFMSMLGRKIVTLMPAMRGLRQALGWQPAYNKIGDLECQSDHRMTCKVIIFWAMFGLPSLSMLDRQTAKKQWTFVWDLNLVIVILIIHWAGDR